MRKKERSWEWGPPSRRVWVEAVDNGVIRLAVGSHSHPTVFGIGTLDAEELIDELRLAIRLAQKQAPRHPRLLAKKRGADAWSDEGRQRPTPGTPA